MIVQDEWGSGRNITSIRGRRNAFGATLGLVIGGVCAAPIGAYAAKRIPVKPMLIFVGVVLTITSVVGIAAALRG